MSHGKQGAPGSDVPPYGKCPGPLEEMLAVLIGVGGREEVGRRPPPGSKLIAQTKPHRFITS